MSEVVFVGPVINTDTNVTGDKRCHSIYMWHTKRKQHWVTDQYCDRWWVRDRLTHRTPSLTGPPILAVYSECNSHLCRFSTDRFLEYAYTDPLQFYTNKITLTSIKQIQYQLQRQQVSVSLLEYVTLKLHGREITTLMFSFRLYIT